MVSEPLAGRGSKRGKIEILGRLLDIPTAAERIVAPMGGSAPTVLEEATQVSERTTERGSLDRVVVWLVLGAVALAGSTIVGAILSRTKFSPVRYTYDPESKNWCFEVPTLGIIGGAATRVEAEQQAREAIAYTKGFHEEGKAATG